MTTSWLRFAIRKEAPAESDAAAVRPYVLDRSNLVVATAVAVVGERTLTELATDLETAFDRFLVDPLKNDKLCRAKLAIVQTLDKLEHLKRDVFLKAATHVQCEPAFGGTVDTAAPLRGAGIFGLARIGGSDYHCLLVDSLVDPRGIGARPRRRRWPTLERRPRDWCFVSRPAWAMPRLTSFLNASPA